MTNKTINLKDKQHKYTKLIGKQFGNLVVKSFYGHNKYKELLWLCECQCENKTKVIVTSNSLTSGKKDNCGCLTHDKMVESMRKYNKYDLSSEYGIGYTNKGEKFYFDLEDYDKIKDYCWNKHKSRDLFYIEARDINKSNNKVIKIHRLIMGVTDGKIKVDHINHNTFDNRKSNLRKTTNQQNCMNHSIHSNNTSGKSGISYRKDSNKWRVRIWYKWKCICLGSFESYEEAVRVRDKAERDYFKEYRNKEGD